MKILAIVKKDLRVLFKDKGALIVLFVLPIMFISVMSFALKPVFDEGESGVIEMLVSDLDGSQESSDFIEELNKVEGIKVISTLDENEVTKERIIKEIKTGSYSIGVVIPEGFKDSIIENEKIILECYEDPVQQNINSVVEKAIEGVGKTYSATFAVSNLVEDQIVEIKSKMNESITTVEEEYKSVFESKLGDVYERFGLKYNGEMGEVETISNDIDYTALEVDLVNKAQETIGESNINILRKQSESEKVKTPDSLQQNVPGYTVMFAFFIVMFAGRSFIVEKNSGTLKRVTGTPVKKWELFVGKFIPNYIIGILQTIIMFSVGSLVFGMSLGNSIIGLVVISIFMIWASTSLGMMIASVVRTESQVVGVSMLVVLTLAALGGTMVPLFIMPDIMQKIALITPHAWALNGYQNLLVRGMSFGEVLPNISALFLFGLFFIVISIWRIKFSD